MKTHKLDVGQEVRPFRVYRPTAALLKKGAELALLGEKAIVLAFNAQEMSAPKFSDAFLGKAVEAEVARRNLNPKA
jgi:hypothetical protein